MPNWGGGASGALSGGSLGMQFGGPIGGAIGAGVGGLVGLFKKKKKSSTTGPSGDEYGNMQGQFQNFANTGGFTPQNLADIRSRTVSPIRSIYSGARRDISRGRSLQGGYSPNYSSALSRMAREQSMSTAEASTGAEANIAEMQQKGRLSGLQGMSDLYRTKMSTPSDYQRKLAGIGGTMSTIGKGAEAFGSIMDAFKPRK